MEDIKTCDVIASSCTINKKGKSKNENGRISRKIYWRYGV